MVTLDEAKVYLRVDYDDEDDMIESLVASAEKLCQDIARLTDEAFEAEDTRVRIAVLYAVAYLYEHREEPDMHDLTLMLRAILFGVREARF